MSRRTPRTPLPHPAPSSHTVHADFHLWEVKALVLAASLHTNYSFVSGEPVSLQGWGGEEVRTKKNKNKKQRRKKERERNVMDAGWRK